MATIRFVATQEGNRNQFIELLQENIDKAKTIEWAVAFGQYSVFPHLEPQFSNFFNRGGVARFVFDLYAGMTDPLLIEELLTYPGESFCRVYYPVENSSLGIFHHKIYNFLSDDSSTSFVGSLNLSSNALLKNFESGVEIKGTSDEEIFRAIQDYYFQNIWNSKYVLSPDSNPEILEDYRAVYDAKRLESSRLRSSRERLEQTFNNTLRLEEGIINSDFSYLFGVLCASSRELTEEQVQNREIVINFRSSIKNRNTEDEGFVCVRIDDNILGNIRIEQRQFQERSIKRIYFEIKRFIKRDNKYNKIEWIDSSKTMTLFKIVISFHEDSFVWTNLKQIIDDFPRSGNKLHPIVPESLMSSTENNKLNFLRGYFDFRSRLSKSDRYPSGSLRIAVQIGTHETNLGNQIVQLLAEFGISAKLSEGAHRNKDSMIRFEPQENSPLLWTSGEYRLLSKAFLEYNKQFI